MKTIQQTEHRKFAYYMQQALQPISKRYYYSLYVNELPLKPTDKILEICSGVGDMAELLAKKVSKGQLICIDISDKYLNVSRNNLKSYPNATLRNGHLANLHLKRNSFDVVNMHFVLHDIPKESREVIVNEMFELLRPGGKVYIREPLRDERKISSLEIKTIFTEAGFYPLFHEENKMRFVGESITACYAKVSTMRFFLT
jgi:ubiquinone/menaquinone biosynthesis C-methylase UbiE